MPMAGKTGTTQNWADAWTVGYSPYYTTAVWFGFDRPGNSLGLTLTGSSLAGPLWADYMREIHLGLPFRDFVRPNAGLIDVSVCAISGLLRTSFCGEGEITLPFMDGTQPVLLCDIHGNNRGRDVTIRHIEQGSMFIDTSDVLRNLTMPVIQDEILLREIQAEQRRNQSWQGSRLPAPRVPTNRAPQSSAGRILSNPLLDDLPPVSLNLPDILSPVPELNQNSGPPVTTPANAEANAEASAEANIEASGEANLEADFTLTPPMFNPLID